LNWLNSLPRARRFFIVLTAIWIIIFFGVNLHTEDNTGLIATYVLTCLIAFLWGMWWTFKKEEA